MKRASVCASAVSAVSEDTIEAELLALLAEGAKLYNAGEFWEAHEAWEQAWIELKEADREQLADLLQGLILATAALENLERGKPSGFATQGAKALFRLRENGERLSELGVRNGKAFREGLLDLYLEVQRRKLHSLEALGKPWPEIVVAEGPEGG